MSKDAMQTKINRLSLVLTNQEDIVKAAKSSDLSPQMLEVLLRLHNQQLESEKAVNELRTTLLTVSKIIDSQATAQLRFSETIQEMSKTIGYDPEEYISSEALGDN